MLYLREIYIMQDTNRDQFVFFFLHIISLQHCFLHHANLQALFSARGTTRYRVHDSVSGNCVSRLHVFHISILGHDFPETAPAMISKKPILGHMHIMFIGYDFSIMRVRKQHVQSSNYDTKSLIPFEN
jgi:hypothetical protein